MECRARRRVSTNPLPRHYDSRCTRTFVHLSTCFSFFYTYIHPTAASKSPLSNRCRYTLQLGLLGAMSRDPYIDVKRFVCTSLPF